MKFLLSLVVCLFAFNAYAEKIYWYLAASMTKPGKAIVKQYNKTHEDEVVLILGGSGQILNKIILSKKGDIYTSANEKYYRKAASDNVVLNGEKLLVQTPVFGISKRAETRIASFEALLKPGIKIALGNPNTMAIGKTYQMKIKPKMPKHIAKKIKDNTIINPTNVSQTTNYVLSGTVDAGLMFDSGAKLNKLDYVEIPDEYNTGVTAYISLVKYSKNKELAKSFLEYVRSNSHIFEEYGYNVVMKRAD
ncbi:molybdate ABC transporter substrate-binding protein [Flexistipes sp.]|uniref:molybdate ABC transporter substrate-binding protein n=1 Tax=Flexistipes sp. TaxID=3088135 RepID=UPI002E1EF595|nr:molybdate ABC transporter substrate-binding protein [Flexistipes sp.]